MRLIALALLLPGCSLLFDPSKVTPLTCPEKPTRCSVRANATAACAGTACAWTCNPGFGDVDQDLTLAASNGCEAQCSLMSAPANPLALTATVGASPGSVLLQWTQPGVSARAFRLCTGAAAGFENTCSELLAADSCVAGDCKTTLSGLPNAVQVFARIQTVDACGTQGSKSTAPLATFAPLDVQAGSGWVLGTTCNAMAQWSSGTLSFEQQGPFCVSTLLAGAALWQDFTLVTQVRFSSVSSQGAYAGLVLRSGAQGHRVLLLLSSSEKGGDETVRISRRLSTGGDDLVASSVKRVPLNEWVVLKVVSRQRELSVSMGATEVLRWRDASATPTLEGSLGFALSSSGRVEFQQLELTTKAVVPDAGTRSARYDFSTGASSDGGFPEDVRVRVPALTTLEPCPAYPAAAGCDGGCVPSASARCVHVRPQLFFPASVGIDLPVGIDTRQPWRMGFNFAAYPLDAGVVSYPALVRGVNGQLLGTAGADYETNLQVLGKDLGRKLVPATWNRAELRFDAAAGSFAVSINGIPIPLASPVFPPPGWDPHLGAFFFGQPSFVFDGWVTDIELSQP